MCIRDRIYAVSYSKIHHAVYILSPYIHTYSVCRYASVAGKESIIYESLRPSALSSTFSSILRLLY